MAGTISSWSGSGGVGAAATNTITTQNLNPSTGTATAHSSVQIPINPGSNGVLITISGTWTCVGGLIPQTSLDGVTWQTQSSATFLTYQDGTGSATISSGATGQWTCFPVGPGFFRLSANGAVTGTATVTLDAGPAGGGGGGGGGSTTIVSPIGQKAMAASVSVAIASDQSAVPVTVSGPLGQTTASASIPTTRNSDVDYRPAGSTITVVDSGSTVSGNQVTGTATAGSTYTLVVNGYGTAMFSVTGTFTATMLAEASFDGGTTWVTNLGILQLPLTSIVLASITAIGQYRVDAPGATHVRLRCTAYTSTPTVIGTATYAPTGTVRTIPGINSPALTTAIVTTSSSGAVTLVAATSGKKTHIVSLLVNASAATNVYIEDDAAGGAAAMSETWYFAANGGVSIPLVALPGGGYNLPLIEQVATNKIVSVNNSNAVAISIRVQYYVA